MENPLAAISETLAAAVEKVARTTVSLHGRPHLGSTGMLWAPNIIVTAEHTITTDDEIRVVRGDGASTTAAIVARDPGTDIAVLRADGIEAPERLNFTATQPKAGTVILAAGRATDGNIAATMGIVSVSGGPWTTWRGGKLDALFRLDMRLYPTASGSAVISPDGAFIGMATAGLTRTLPAAVPAKTVDRIVRELIETGQVRRGYLGVGVQPVALPEQLVRTAGLTSRRGLIVLNTEPDSPAQRAGIVLGDIIIALQSSVTPDLAELQAALSIAAPGSVAKVQVIRGGAPLAVDVEIGSRPERG